MRWRITRRLDPAVPSSLLPPPSPAADTPAARTPVWFDPDSITW